MSFGCDLVGRFSGSSGDGVAGSWLEHRVPLALIAARGDARPPCYLTLSVEDPIENSLARGRWGGRLSPVAANVVRLRFGRKV